MGNQLATDITEQLANLIKDVIATAQSAIQRSRSEAGRAIDPAFLQKEITRACQYHDLDQAHAQAIADELMRRMAVRVGEDLLLTEAKGHTPWFETKSKKPWRYWTRHEQFLKQTMPIAVIEALDESTDLTLANLADPKDPKAQNQRGLVVGHVQSGKTGHYTALMNKAMDAGYKIIIVLAGMHNNLRSQTQIRIEEQVLGYKTPLGSSVDAIGVGLIDKDPAIIPQCATDRSDAGDFAKNKLTLSVTPEEKPWVFVIKKQKTVLENLHKWIKNADLRGFPVLVIDDEADHASVDTGEQSVDAHGAFDEDYQPKAINSLIRKILRCFNVKSYLAYTATPFANIFIHREAGTKDEGPDLFPKSFIQSLSAPSNYAGAERIFGAPGPNGREGALPLVRCFDDIGAKGSWMHDGHDKSHVPTFQGQEILPPSLRCAIHEFVLASAARCARGQASQHSSMLIHVTRFTQVQSHVKEQVREFIESMKRKIKLGIGKAELTETLRTLWISDFEPTSLAMATLDKDTAATAFISWEEARAHVDEVIASIETKLINGSAKDALDYTQGAIKGSRLIAIGGEKLSRGLTLEGLCVSYFSRTTKMYDTLMQMGRWFGYRSGYLDLCRLHTTEALVECFQHIADASEELRAAFDDMTSRGATPAEYGLRVASHPAMLVTSALKMRNAHTMQLSFGGDVLETITLHNDEDTLNANLKATDDLIGAMGDPSQTDPKLARNGHIQSWKGHVWRKVPHQLVEDFLQSFKTHPCAHKVKDTAIYDYAATNAKRGELTDWDVAIFGAGDGARHVFSNGLSTPPMSQRKAVDVSGPERMSIGRLLDPKDEGVFLDEADYLAALEITPQHLVEGKGARALPSGPAMRRIRGMGAKGAPAKPRRGILILYPLDPQLASDTLFGDRLAPVMAYGVSFPATDNDVKIKYVVDAKTWEEYYGGQ